MGKVNELRPEERKAQSIDPILTDDVRALRARVIELEKLLGIRVEDAALVPEAAQIIEGFFDQTLVMFVIADLVEGRFLRVNQKLCDTLGYSEQEILESSFLDRVHPADHLQTMYVMEQLVAGEQTRGFRNRHLAADGSYIVFEWTAIVDPDRELCYAVAIEIVPKGGSPD